MELINKKRSFEMYYDPYDVVIHCDSEKARDEVLADLKAINDRLDVLDKIRAEIEKRADDYFASGSYDKDLYNSAYKDALYWCFDLIDKYKAESEG